MEKQYNNHINIRPLIDEAVSDIDLINPYSGSINFNSFETKDELNQKLFDGSILKDDVRTECIELANKFISFCDLKKEFIYDIVLVGSSVSYHYSSYSDIDIHIIVYMSLIGDNIEEVNSDLLEKRSEWASKNKSEIADYDAELFIQDINDQNITSGIYSLTNNEWIKEPNKDGEISFDKAKIEQKSLEYIKQIDDICDNNDSESAKELKSDLHIMRKHGLESPAGEMSEENIIFKVLRRTGHLQKLKELENQTNESMNKQFENEVYDIATSVINRLKLNESKNVCESTHDGFEDWDMTTIYDVRNFVEYVLTTDAEQIKKQPFIIKDLFVKCGGLATADNSPLSKECMDNIYTKLYNIMQSIKNGNDVNLNNSLRSLREIIKTTYPFNSPSLPIGESSNLYFNDSLNEWEINPRIKRDVLAGATGLLLGLGVSQYAISNFNRSVENNMSVETIISDSIESKQEAQEPELQSFQKPVGCDDIKVSERGKQFVKDFEKCVLTPYVPKGTNEERRYRKNKRTDNVGKTIGWGHKIKESDPEWLKSSKCKSITKAQANALFEQDVKEFEGYMKKHISRLPNRLNTPDMFTQEMIDAIFSMEWNMGPSGFVNCPFYASLQKCRYDKDTDYFNKSDIDFTLSKIKSSNVSDPGHKIRRAAEYKMATKGIYDSTH